MTYLLIYLSLILVWVVIVKLAPDGYEDEKGFHLNSSKAAKKRVADNLVKSKVQLSKSA